MRKPKQKKVEEYINCDSTCPWCDSEDISSGDAQFDSSIAWRDVWCEECGAEWQDCYTLTHISWRKQVGKRLERLYSDEVFGKK